MKRYGTLAILGCTMLAGCATPPTAEQLSTLPVVAYPHKPTTRDYVYKLPAGRPIDVKIVADGTALAQKVEKNISANLAHDIYLHKQWASEDGVHWVRADKLIGISMELTLPGYATPGPGKLHLTVNNKMAK